MKRFFAVLCMAAMAVSLLTGCKDNDTASQQTDQTSTPVPTDSEDDTDSQELLMGTHHATIEVENYGTITLELDADTAPITVTNFVNLANEGFYDSLTFHRIMSGFMMQGGDPKANGTGGSDEKIKGEFSSNGVENDISHLRGTISMARSKNNDSASSQFFIVHQDSTFLDGDYAAFGKVTDGMDVVDTICASAKPIDDNGTIPRDQQPVIKKITILD